MSFFRTEEPNIKHHHLWADGQNKVQNHFPYALKFKDIIQTFRTEMEKCRKNCLENT